MYNQIREKAMKLHVCERCGGPRRLIDNTFCAQCRKDPKDLCSGCGGQKLLTSLVCRRCHARTTAQALKGTTRGRQPRKDACSCGRLKNNESPRCWTCYAEEATRPPEILERGYVMVKLLGVKDRIQRSRLVMAKILGRKLTPNEHVHHRNGIKTDDRPENLVVLTRSQHTILHHAQGDIHSH